MEIYRCLLLLTKLLAYQGKNIVENVGFKTRICILYGFCRERVSFLMLSGFQICLGGYNRNVTIWMCHCKQGCGVGRKESGAFGWSRCRILKNTRSRVFHPTPEVQLNHLLHRTPKLGILTRAYWNGATSSETFNETALLLWTAISIDWYSLQNCWQPNFVHVMLKRRCRKIFEARSRSWRWTFYLRLRNPVKEKKNSFTTFLVNYSVWSKANILAKGSFANIFLTFFRFFKVNLEMGKVIMLQNMLMRLWSCNVNLIADFKIFVIWKVA